MSKLDWERDTRRHRVWEESRPPTGGYQGPRDWAAVARQRGWLLESFFWRGQDWWKVTTMRGRRIAVGVTVKMAVERALAARP